jgi:hypothetical protein
MLKPLGRYLKDEGFPRWRDICFNWETFLSLAVLVGFLFVGNKFFAEYPKIGDLTTGLIAYCAIALGFCVAGLTISLTIPDRSFAVWMARHTSNGRKSSYSDLLFVFSWTAVVHWVSLLCLFGVVLFADSSKALMVRPHGSVRLWIAAIITSICFYCLCQFLITLITLSQVGAVYLGFLANDDPPKE